MIKVFQKKPVQVLVLVVLLIAVFFLLWLNFLGGKPTNSFQTATASKGNIIKTIVASGSIISAGSVTVSTPASGMVSHLYVTPGQNVAFGQKIADLQLDQAGITQRDKLWSKYLAAKSTLESARSQFAAPYVINQSTTDLAIAWQNYNDALGIITAPVAGVVRDLKVVPGISISAGAVATIQSANEVFSRISVSEMDISQVSLGQKALITIPAISGKSFTGKVVAIDTKGIAKSGVIHYTVTVSVDNPTPQLLTNMSADIKVILAEKDNVLVVPLSAVQNNKGSDVVSIIKNGKLTGVAVKVGVSNDTQVEILSGLSLNDTVVTGTTSSQPTAPASTSIFNGLTNPSGLAVPGGGSNN